MKRKNLSDLVALEFGVVVGLALVVEVFWSFEALLGFGTRVIRLTRTDERLAGILTFQQETPK